MRENGKSTARKECVGKEPTVPPQGCAHRALCVNIALIVALMGLVFLAASFLIPNVLLPLVMGSLT